MFFRVAVLSLLGSSFLMLLVISGQRRATHDVHLIGPSAPVHATRLTVDTVLVDVRRDELERLLPAALRDARVVPHLHQGKVDGLRLYGVQRTSLWRTLGLRNGDIVYEVNGAIPGDASALATLNGSARRPDFLDLTIRRRSRMMRIVVVIHPT